MNFMFLDGCDVDFFAVFVWAAARGFALGSTVPWFYQGPAWSTLPKGCCGLASRSILYHLLKTAISYNE